MNKNSFLGIFFYLSRSYKNNVGASVKGCEASFVYVFEESETDIFMILSCEILLQKQVFTKIRYFLIQKPFFVYNA